MQVAKRSLLAVIAFCGGFTSFAQTWNLANNGFTTKSVGSIAASADGNMLAAIIFPGPSNGGIYTSTNSGQTWISNSVPAGKWSSIASSADGSKLAATINGGGIYTLTDSAGVVPDKRSHKLLELCRFIGGWPSVGGGGGNQWFDLCFDQFWSHLDAKPCSNQLLLGIHCIFYGWKQISGSNWISIWVFWSWKSRINECNLCFD
jgi:hypothetical protein